MGIAALLLLARNIYVIGGLPREAAQGAIFKIIFFHVPAAMTGIVAATVAMIMSVMFLVTKDFKYDAGAVAVTEVGLAFLAVNLVTGSLWGRVIWGIWWTWDARLTSALICWLLYAGYLMLRHAVEEPTQRATLAAVFSIFRVSRCTDRHYVYSMVPHAAPGTSLFFIYREFPTRLDHCDVVELAGVAHAGWRNDGCAPSPGRSSA